MTKVEQNTWLALGVVAVGAFFVLRERRPQVAPTFTPIVGTGAALRIPTTPAPMPTTAEPTMWERFKGLFEGAPMEPQTSDWWRAELAPLFRQQERAFAMPDGLLEAIADRESRFRDDIITCETLGSAGEEGIMQLKPQFHLSSRAERCNPQTAIPYAARYLSKNYLRFGNSWDMAIIAYTWGPTDLENYGLQAAPADKKTYLAWVKERPYVEGFA